MPTEKNQARFFEPMQDFALRYPAIARALQNLPDETVIHGEVVAFD
jgi:hypothetical protein